MFGVVAIEESCGKDFHRVIIILGDTEGEEFLLWD